MESKNEEVIQFSNKSKRIINQALNKRDYNLAMESISALAYIFYQYNQFYVDDFLETSVTNISEKLFNSNNEINRYKYNDNTVLFYDGFGLDTRGVSKMYLKGLINNNYNIVYLIPKSKYNHMPATDKIIKDGNVVKEYFDDNSSYINISIQIVRIVLKHRPKAMFFYTRPNDVSGAVAFSAFKNKAYRYLIDLTDHAFWIGRNSNDYFCGSREMACSNQVYGRKIQRNQCIKIGVYLDIPVCEKHADLPFDITKKKYIFSGGALYKTLGDPNNYYYRIIDHILEKYNDVYFLYAGSGDTTEMNKLIKKYPNRAFLIGEREDFYYIIQNCILYLNTYPMFGGMMMKYAAHANRIPITLMHNNDSDGLLINQKRARIEYSSYDDLINDVDKLIEDENYMNERRKLLEGTTISEERFTNNLKTLIEHQYTDYAHEYRNLDTTKFRQEFYNRFEFDKAFNAVISRKNIKFLLKFPEYYGILIKKSISKLNKYGKKGK